MEINDTSIPKHACQYCGSELKLVETIIDDEFVWDKNESQYIPNGFKDQFKHSGEECCALCHKDWTGLREE